MSFCSTIYGNLPDSGFVYTATTVSVLNGSFENLSATNATIVNLETTTIQPHECRLHDFNSRRRHNNRHHRNQRHDR